MKTIQDFKLIIFDLDGTLINSMYDLTDALNYALQKMQRPTINYDQLPGMLGGGVQHLLEQVLVSYTTTELQQTRQLFEGYYEQHYADKTIVYPTVIDTLKALKDIKTAVYSNKIDVFTQKIVQALGLAPYFDYVQGARPELYKRKPSAQGINHILEHFNIAAADTLMVGDSTHDVHAAQAAGTRSCAVSYGYRSEAVLRAAKADAIIQQMSELLDVQL